MHLTEERTTMNFRLALSLGWLHIQLLQEFRLMHGLFGLGVGVKFEHFTTVMANPAPISARLAGKLKALAKSIDLIGHWLQISGFAVGLTSLLNPTSS